MPTRKPRNPRKQKPPAQPTQQFDTTLKQLFQAYPSRLLELLLGAVPLELVTIELPSVKQRRADLAYRLPDGKLHQFELQSDNDDEMDPRMLEYYALYWRLDGQPPVQHVLYVGNAPLKMTGRVEHPRLHYSYEVTDIREFDAEQLLQSEFLTDNLIAVLCRNGTEPSVVQQILRRIAALPEQQRMDRLEQLLILSGLRKATDIVIKEAKKMPLQFNPLEDPYLHKLYLKGEQSGIVIGERRGIAIGEQRGESRMLQFLIEQRFGKLPKWAVRQLAEADSDTLTQWGGQLIKAARLEDILPKPRARAKH